MYDIFHGQSNVNSCSSNVANNDETVHFFFLYRLSFIHSPTGLSNVKSRNPKWAVPNRKEVWFMGNSFFLDHTFPSADLCFGLLNEKDKDKGFRTHNVIFRRKETVVAITMGSFRILVLFQICDSRMTGSSSMSWSENRDTQSGTSIIESEIVNNNRVFYRCFHILSRNDNVPTSFAHKTRRENCYGIICPKE
jgi:hypothetical protein